MRRVQFGSGSLGLDGYENYDLDVDISKPLPRDRFPDASVGVIFSEMCVEHVTPQQAWSFLEECHRILSDGGIIRIVIPDFVRCFKIQNPDWMRVNHSVTGNDGSVRDQMKSILFSHGHQGLWTAELMQAVMEAIGFKRTSIHNAGESNREEFKNIEQHHKSVGYSVAFAESGCVEGAK